MIGRTKVLFAAVTLCAAAAPAGAAVGDVISSFAWSNARNAYRDAGYVYCVAGVNTLRAYTPGGSLVRTVTLGGLTSAGDADHTPSGAGYFAVIQNSSYIYEYQLSTGSFVQSMYLMPGILGGGYCPGSPYIYLHASPIVGRFTTSGSLIGSFLVSYSAGALAASDRLNGVAGDYVVVAGRTSGATSVYTGTGSMVTTFTVPGSTLGCVCGPGYPSTSATAYWYNVSAGSSTYAYQIDLGNATAVAPASVGRIKALYR